MIVQPISLLTSAISDDMLIVVALDEFLKPLPDAKLDTLEVDLEKELNDIGAFFPMRFIWGRKPYWSSGT